MSDRWWAQALFGSGFAVVEEVVQKLPWAIQNVGA